MSRRPLIFISIIILAYGLGISALGRVSAQSPNPQSDSIGLEGRIPSDAPKTAATITTPSNGQVFTTVPITIAGLCNSDDLLVKVFKNNVFAGSAQCKNGSYSIKADLFNGTNEIVARVYNALDQAGPDSNTVTVTFNEPGFNNGGPRIGLTSNFAKRGANPGQVLTWPIILSGGSGPYALSIDWGDGKDDLMSKDFAGNIDIKHTYEQSGVYLILIKATDSNGVTAYLQITGVANGPLSQDNAENTSNVIIRERTPSWPLIVAAVLICVSFWLGRRSKLISLRREAEKRVQF